MQPSLLQERVLTDACGAEDRSPEVARDVDRGEPDAAARVVDQHLLVGLQRAHHDQQLPGRQIVDRNRRRLFETQRNRFLEDLRLRHDDGVGIAAEPSEGQHLFADPAGLRLRPCGIDNARDLVADNGRQLRSIRIEALAGQDIREVDAARLDPDAKFDALRLGVGRLAQLQVPNAPSRNGPDLLHGAFFLGDLTSAITTRTARAAFAGTAFNCKEGAASPVFD